MASGTRSISKARDQIQRLRTQTANLRKKAAQTTRHVVTAVETVGATYGAGYISARNGGSYKIFDAPAELVAGLAGHGLVILGVGGGADEHIRAVSNGLLAAYAFQEGAKVGSKAARGASVRGVEIGAFDLPRQGNIEIGAGEGLDDLLNLEPENAYSY